MKSITSAANPHFRAWLQIAESPRATREQGRTLADGVHLAQAALAACYPIESALVRQGGRHAEIEACVAQAAARGATVYELTPALFDRLSPVEHSAGLLLVLPIGRATPPHQVNADALYLDGVQDPGNAGALIRVAAAAGVHSVLAAPTTVALWSPKVLRAAQGAHFRLAVHERIDAPALRSAITGPWIAATAHRAISLWEVDLPATPIGWAFGAEGRGIRPEVEALCTQRVQIPIDSAVESLNVAAAAAVCLFERRRRLSCCTGDTP
ncbi:MAG TPA: RNA methyltransferase [Burkholderiaceae bacterium]|nr:RNA methyltransferase [Burkholderiaceae bacterium]